MLKESFSVSPGERLSHNEGGGQLHRMTISFLSKEQGAQFHPRLRLLEEEEEEVRAESEEEEERHEQDTESARCAVIDCVFRL